MEVCFKKKKIKQKYFVVQLNTSDDPKVDTDKDIENPLMDTRIPFLRLCQNNNLEFSDEIRASVSLTVLY